MRSLVVLRAALVAPASIARRDTSSCLQAPISTLRIKGTFDCSNRIVITHEHAVWQATAPASLGEVSFGGVTWRPADAPVLDNAGATRFLSDQVRLESARLRNYSGRDLVGLEATPEAVTVFVTDTPPGPGEYAFDVEFERAGPSAELKVRAVIDGSDVLHIGAARLGWQHVHWSVPTDVVVGGKPWNVEAQPEISHELLPTGVDLSTARIVERRGRDTVCLRIEDDHVDLLFADDPPGAGEYEVTIRFGR